MLAMTAVSGPKPESFSLRGVRAPLLGYRPLRDVRPRSFRYGRVARNRPRRRATEGSLPWPSPSSRRIYGLTTKARSLLGLRVSRTEIVLRAGASGRQERLACEVLVTELEREPIALLD